MSGCDYSGMQVIGSQYAANASMIPASIGWCIQLYLCGVSTDRARRVLSHPKYHEARASGVPGTRMFLLATTILNLLYSIVTIWDNTAWQVNQNRTDSGLNQLLLPDVIGPLLGGIVGVIVPAFMAVRCWRILGKSIIFAITISSLLCTVMGSLIWTCFCTYRYYLGRYPDEQIFIPTQLWLFSSATADVLITVCLTLHLKRMKRGFNTSTDNFLDSLVRLAFETSLPPALSSLASAVIYACTYRSTYGWNTYFGIVPYIPSLYLLSFTYCLQGTRARSRLMSESKAQGPASGKANPNGKALGARLEELTKSQSWQAPHEWQSSLGNPEDELESFQSGRRVSVPFVSYRGAGEHEPSTFAPTEFRQPRRPLLSNVTLTMETSTSIDIAEERVNELQTKSPNA